MPTTVTVSRTKRGAHRTIGAALESTRRRPLCVLIERGSYQESLTIGGDVEFAPADGPVSIEAAEGTTVTCSGDVAFRGVTIINYNGTALKCESGRLTLEQCTLRGMGKEGACVRAEPGTEVTLRSTGVRTGPVYLTGASGVLEECRLVASRTNGVWVQQGGSLRISGGSIADPSGHAVRANGASVEISRCTITGAGSAALAIADDAELTFTGSTVRDSHKSAVDVMRQSKATIDACSFERCERAVWATDGSSAKLSGVTVEGARVSAVTAHTSSKVELVECDSRAAVRYGAYVGGGSELTARRFRVEGSEMALWLNAGRADLTGLRVSGADLGVRVDDLMTARIEDAELTGCGEGVSLPKGKGQLELVGLTLTGPRGDGISLAGDARLTVRDCTVSAAGGTGVLLAGSARIDATGLTVRDGAGAGVRGTETARLTLRESTVTGNAGGDLDLEDGCVRDVTGSTVGRQVLAVAAGGADGEGLPPARAAGQVADPGDPMAELAELIGLEPVKRQVRTQVNIIRLAEQRRAVGLPTPQMSRHLVFSGPPGTGKTTVARLYGRILAALGVLGNGTVHEVARSDLVGKYLGHTAPKTREAFSKARGGVLFIDEAYALSRTFGANSDFGQEAIDELVKQMEDQRDHVVVIVAGYTAEMEQFLSANPGLSSRFSRTIEFPPYSPGELLRIIELIASRAHYELQDALRQQLLEYFQREAGGDSPGNARDARTLFETMMENQAERLSTVDAPTVSDLTLLLPADLPWAST